MAPRKKKLEKNKEVSLEESWDIISSISDDDILSIKNHRKHDIRENTYRFTCELLSIELLISLLEHDKVKNVYFNSSVAPPGAGLDSISMRFKVYVQYHFLEDD